MLPSYRTWSPLRVGVAAFGVVALGLGTWLVGSQLVGRANPSVNGVCDSVDRCLEPTQASDFIGRAIESDPDQAVGKHEWDFNGSGSYGTVVNCTGSACTQPCGDGSHSDCSVTSYSYSDPTFFAAANERQVNVHLRGVDTEGAAGAGEIRKVGVAIAYVGPDRGTSGLGVSGVGAGGFTVTWRDVTDIPGSAYTLHVENLDDGTADSIPVTNNKAIGDAYSVAYVAEPSTDYIVWVAAYYPTPLGSITRRSLPGDPIGAVSVSTPANGLPTLTIVNGSGVPPAMVAPHYQLLRQPNNTFTLNITVSDPDLDQLAELRIDGLASLPGASFSGFGTPTPGPVTRTMTWNLGATPPPSGDYSITVVARDVVGGITSRPLVVRLNASPDAPSVLYVNTNDATAGLPSGDPSPVAQVVDDNLSDQNLKFTFRHGDPEGDAAATYRINVDTDSAFASPLTWDSGSRPLAVANGSRSANITYTGPALAYGTDYWWRVQAGDTNGNLSSFAAGRFKLRPTNYVPDLAPINATYSVEVGSTLTVNLTATDQDVTDGLQTLTYFAQGGLPSPQMALNPTTGAFTFTPAPSDLAGSPFSVTLCVRDSYVPPAQDCNPASSISVTLNLVAPTSLNVAFTSPTAGTASWTHSAPGEQGFQLDQTAPVSTPNLAEVGANITNAGFTFNQCGSTSTVGFRVRAFVDAAVRMFSGEATANAPRPGFAPPTGLAVTATGLNTARLTWVPGTTGQSGYAVYNGATRLANAAAAATTYDFSGLTPASAYTLSVRPFVTVPGCPSGGEVLGGYANVNWTQPNPGISVSPASLAFGNVVKDTQSPTMTVRVTNSGSVTLTGITAAISGADAGQFSLLNTPPASIPPSPPASAYWDAQIQFRPTAYGAKAAQLQVQVPSFGLSGTSNLTGTGVPVAPVITSASWTANEPSKFDATWTWGTPPNNPDDFYLRLPAGVDQLHVTDGGNRGISGQPLTPTNCYAATGSTHMLNLVAWDNGYSAPATLNMGQRPGWEGMVNLNTVWLDNTSVRLTWDDPTPSRSAYEIRLWTGAGYVLSVTTTDDATSKDLTGLVPGTNYNILVRPFRTPADMPGCSAPVYGERVNFSYRQPNINLQVSYRGFTDVLSDVNLFGVPFGEVATLPLTIRNVGDALTISGASYETSGATFYGDDFTGWSAGPFPSGATLDASVVFGTSATSTGEATLTLHLSDSDYGQVLSFPIRLTPLVFTPGYVRQVVYTNATHNGNFRDDPGLQGATVQEKANDFCQDDTATDDSKSWRAVLWFGNALPGGTLDANVAYYRGSQFKFGSNSTATDLPWVAQTPICNSGGCGGVPVRTGRRFTGGVEDCNGWTSAGSLGAIGNGGSSGPLTQWSNNGAVSAVCSVGHRIYCVEKTPLDGNLIVTTAGTYSGDIVSLSPVTARTGLVAPAWYEIANNVCRQDAGTNDSFGWKALITTNNSGWPQTVTNPGVHYFNRYEQPLFTAASVNDVPADLSNSIDATTPLNAWTGYGPSGFICSGWASTSGNGYAGDPRVSSPGWRYISSDLCSASRRLYCVQRGAAKRIVYTAAGHNGDFANDGSLTGSNAWEKASDFCQRDTATDDGSQWKALLFKDGVFAPESGTIIHAGVTYVSPLNHQLFEATADNVVPIVPSGRAIFAPLNGQLATNISSWAGYGVGNANCQNWSTSLSSQNGNAGSTDRNDNGWISQINVACNSGINRLYCVEQ